MMEYLCKDCPYFEDNWNLQDYCIHKEFCERAFMKGISDNGIIADAYKFSRDDKKVIFTIKECVSIRDMEYLFKALKKFLAPINCIIMPENVVEYQSGEYATYLLKNKFHYREGEWFLTSEKGKIFSPVVKDAISELLPTGVSAYNEFVVTVVKVKEDYRDAGDTEIN